MMEYKLSQPWKKLIVAIVTFIVLCVGVSNYAKPIKACMTAADCTGSQVCSEATGEVWISKCDGANPPLQPGTCGGGCGPGNDPNNTDPWTCFAAGTKVKMGAGEQKNIEDIVVGDKVLSQDEMGNKSVSTVTELDQPIREHMCRVDFVEGHELNMTVEHPVMTQSGWKSITPSETAEENPELVVSALQLGDQVVREEGEPGVVKDITCWSGKTPAYNLILDGTARTYFADGYLAHNKGYTPPTCSTGTLSCATPATLACVKFPESCGAMFPSKGYYGNCSDGQLRCQVNCNCCQAGEVNQCEAGTYLYTYSSTRHTTPSGGGKDEPIDSKLCEQEDDAYISTTNKVCTYASDKESLISCDWTSQCQRCGCVPICSSTAPAAPALQLPGNGDSVPTEEVTLSWSEPSPWGTACSGTQGYKVYVKEGVAPDPLVDTPILTDSNVTPFTGEKGKTYYWFVRANNGSAESSAETVWSFTILDMLQVSVFNDVDNTCSKAIPWSTATLGPINVTYNGVSSALGVDGTVSLNPLVGGPYGLGVSIPSSYICSMGGCGDCAVSIKLPESSLKQYFYLTSSRGAWWQTKGAGVYAGGQVTSILPSASSRLILAPAGGTAAALLTATVDPNLGSLGSVSDSLWMAKTKYKGKIMNYDYFAAHMGVVRGQTSDWSSDEIDLSSYPMTKDFGYKNGVGTVSSDIQVTAGDSYVVFVNGNLHIGANITVDQGGFLAFIVNGSVTVAPGVDTIQGLYVMDESFVTESNSPIADAQLDTQGTVVAWSTFSLSRDLGNSNATIPAEKFTYRPDLLTNMPDSLKMFAMQWQEVVAGSFE